MNSFPFLKTRKLAFAMDVLHHIRRNIKKKNTNTNKI